MPKNVISRFCACALGGVSKSGCSRFLIRLQHGAANGPLMLLKRVSRHHQDMPQTPISGFASNLTESSGNATH